MENKKPDSRFTFEKLECPMTFATGITHGSTTCCQDKCEWWTDDGTAKGCSIRIQAEATDRISDSLAGIKAILMQILGQLKTKK